MRSPVRLVRNIDAGRLFDTFLVTSVATVLITRLYLHLSGYPQIASASGLHIAHLLPGGLLMLAALLITMGAINRSSRDLAAYLGGIGFGLFWDELGKFITQDNNYFFKPAVGIMYISFVALYLVTRYVIRRTYHSQDYLANAVALATEGIINELDDWEYRRARELLALSDPAHPMYKTAAALIEQAKPTKDYQPFILSRWLGRARKPFHALVRKPWFGGALITSFYVYGLGIVAVVIITLVDTSLGRSAFSIIVPDRTHTIAIISSCISAFFIVWGAYFVQISRVHEALRKFESAILINIFVTQVFFFFSYQLEAIAALVIALILLAAVRILLGETNTAKRSL